MGKEGEEGFFLISAGNLQQPRPSSVLQIFHEAAKLLGRSWRPLLSISLILLLPYSLLLFGNYLTVTPLTVDLVKKFFTMSSKDPRSPEFRELLAAAMEDLRGITAAEAVTQLVSHLLTLLLVMAAVYTLAMANKGEMLTLRELFSRMRRTWKGPLVTGLYVYLLSSGYMTALFILIVVFAFVSLGSTAVLALVAVISVMAMLLLLYLQVVWSQGLVVSVVEEDYYGLAALGRASELVQGRRRLGFRLNAYFMLMTSLLFLAYHTVERYLPPCKNMQLAKGLLLLYASLMVSIFSLAAYVVFYYECKRNHGEEVAMNASLGYNRLPSTAPTLDGALP